MWPPLTRLPIAMPRRGIHSQQNLLNDISRAGRRAKYQAWLNSFPACWRVRRMQRAAQPLAAGMGGTARER